MEMIGDENNKCRKAQKLESQSYLRAFNFPQNMGLDGEVAKNEIVLKQQTQKEWQNWEPTPVF